MRWLVVLLFLLPGCTEEPLEPELTPTVETEPQNMTLYLRPDGGVGDAPEPAEQSIDWGYAQWLEGARPPAWVGDDVAGWRVLSGQVTLYYRAETANSGADVRPELTAWWGSDRSLYHHLFIDGPDTVQPGQVVEASAELSIPPGGFVMAAGTQPVLRVGTYYLDGPQASTMTLLMGGDTASRMDLVVEPLLWPALTSEELPRMTGTLTGGLCAVPLNPTQEANSYHDIEIGADVRGFEVEVIGDGGPTPDLDLVVYGPNGTVVGGGHSSFEVEGATIWWQNLNVDGPGTYRLRVLACTFQTGSYDLDVTLYR